MNQYDLPKIKTKKIIGDSKIPPMRRFQRYPKFADRKIQKILRFTGFFNLLKSSAQSSEYLFKKLKIVSWSVFFDIAVLQLITAKESAHKAEVVLS